MSRNVQLSNDSSK